MIRAHASTLGLLALCAAGLLAIVPGRAGAASLWGMEGIGCWIEGYDTAAHLSGGTAIGVIDPYQMSSVNPAGIAWAVRPQANLGIIHGNRWIETPASGQSHRRANTRLTGLGVVIPGPNPLVWRIGYRDLTDGTYRVEMDENVGREDAFTRTLRGSGGLGELSASMAARLLEDRASVGIHLGAAGGTLHDVSEDDYDSPDYRSTRNTLRTRVENGVRWSAGFQARPAPGLVVGGVYHGPVDLDLKALWETTTGLRWERRAGLDLPSSYGLGASYVLGRRHRIALDWNAMPWSEAEFRSGDSADQGDAGGFQQLQDTNRMGIGYTWLPDPKKPGNAPILERTVWRAGFSWGELPILQDDGTSVGEWAVSLGLGLPVQVDRGFLDVGFEYGRTGNLDEVGLEETFLRLQVGVTFGQFRSRF